MRNVMAKKSKVPEAAKHSGMSQAEIRKHDERLKKKGKRPLSVLIVAKKKIEAAIKRAGL
jgi:hypothetical protein